MTVDTWICAHKKCTMFLVYKIVFRNKLNFVSKNVQIRNRPRSLLDRDPGSGIGVSVPVPANFWFWPGFWLGFSTALCNELLQRVWHIFGRLKNNHFTPFVFLFFSTIPANSSPDRNPRTTKIGSSQPQSKTQSRSATDANYFWQLVKGPAQR